MGNVLRSRGNKLSFTLLFRHSLLLLGVGMAIQEINLQS